MPTINIHREKHVIKNVLQKWRVYVDNKLVAKLPDDDVISFKVSSGEHEMKVGGPVLLNPFARKWMQSNKIIFNLGEGDVLTLRVSFHPLWSLTYRKPGLWRRSECLVLFPLEEKSIEQLNDNIRLLTKSYKNILTAAHPNKWDILAHICCMLTFISLPIIFKSTFTGLLEWFGFCFMIGIVTLFTENKAYVLAGRNAFLSLTILLGYRNAYNNASIALGAALCMALFFFRYMKAYRQFKRMNEQLKEEDYFFGILNV